MQVVLRESFIHLTVFKFRFYKCISIHMQPLSVPGAIVNFRLFATLSFSHEKSSKFSNFRYPYLDDRWNKIRTVATYPPYI